MEIPEILKKLLQNATVIELGIEHGPDCDHFDDDASDWIQVARLGQEDTLKRKAHLADLAKAKSDIEVLLSKLEAVKAGAIAKKTEYWAFIREKYSLPAKRPLRIADDGRILMKPEKEKS
jgi:hypothetical protein